MYSDHSTSPGRRTIQTFHLHSPIRSRAETIKREQNFLWNGEGDSGRSYCRPGTKVFGRSRTVQLDGFAIIWIDLCVLR